MRCFIGIVLPQQIKENLFELQKQIGNEYAKIKWVEKKSLHITLKFLDEIDEDAIKLTKIVLKNVKFRRFATNINNIGWYPNDNKLNVIWVGLKPEEELLNLHGEVELKLGNLFEKDERFSVHLTLGRVKYVKHKEKLLEKLKNLKVKKDRLLVDSFSLIKSDLTKDRPAHTQLERYYLE